jgi:diguanylate cyclase (GGDEF)-like protein/PAS domain S-box-containing protein
VPNAPETVAPPNRGCMHQEVGMTLRTRLLLSVGLAVTLMAVGLYYRSADAVLSGIEKLERQDARADVVRVQRGVDQLLDDLHLKAVDWAEWDDAYAFMKDHNRAFIQSNCPDQTLSTMKLDALVFVDTMGRTVYSKTIPRIQDATPPSVANICKALGFGTAARAKAGQAGMRTILVEHGLPLMVSLRPILTSRQSGPARGWLVFARYFDSEELARLAERTQLRLDAFEVNAASNPADVRAAAASLNGSNGIHLRPENSQVFRGYTSITDLNGAGIQVVRVTVDRHAYAQGLAILRYLLVQTLLIGAVFIAVALIVLERFALSRIADLGSQVENAGAEGTVALSGKDELSTLARRISDMLASIRAGEQKLREANQNLEEMVAARTAELMHKNAVLENAVDGIAQLDLDGKHVEVNAAYASLFGLQPAEVLGRHWTDFIAPNEEPKIGAAINVVAESGKAAMEVVGVRGDGSTFDSEIVLVAERNEDGVLTGYHCFARDVSVRKRLEADIVHQAFHDSLTGLPNRALFMDRLNQAVRSSARTQRPVAVLFVDLDRFKLINDSLGHESGDLLLQAVTERIMGAVRANDTVARLGGDEFTVLMQDVQDTAEADNVAERINACLRAAVALPQREVFVTASVGICFGEGGELTADEMLKRADTAMYFAKENGKAGFATYGPIMQDSVAGRIELEVALRQAVRDGKIIPFYQPLLDLETGLLAGVEALARWHTAQGIIPPGKFIPIAEESGLIIPLGYSVLEQACRQARQWHLQFPDREPITVNVNLSGRQLQCADVVERVAAIVAETGIDPRCLKLEITESVLMTDLDGAIERLRRLKHMGVKLAIDDFGTGYSSLSSLGTFPVDTVKIDRSFVSRLGDQPEAASIISAIVMVAKTLGMDITGEGVETREQVALLQSLGCSVGQGFLFGRPSAAASLGERISTSNKFWDVPTTMDDRQRIEELLAQLTVDGEQKAA